MWLRAALIGIGSFFLSLKFVMALFIVETLSKLFLLPFGGAAFIGFFGYAKLHLHALPFLPASSILLWLFKSIYTSGSDSCSATRGGGYW